MRINLSVPQVMALIDIDKESTAYGEAIILLKNAIKSEVNVNNQKIDSLIFELTKNGYRGEDSPLETLTNKLKTEVTKIGNAKKDKYFDESGGFENIK